MKRLLPAVISVCFGMILSSCVNGPPRDKDTPLSYLNGDNYHANSVGGAPVVFERQGKSTKLKGVLTLSDVTVPAPLGNQVLLLMRDEKEILKTRTDSTGAFLFSGDLPSGNYKIKFAAKCLRAELPVELKDYEYSGLQVVATRAPACVEN